jgi:hypothetical protein
LGIFTELSSYIHKALDFVIPNSRITSLEQKQIAGYQQVPVLEREFDLWDAEQVWEEGGAFSRLC